jgi:zinc-binding alcohol dehydrogenase family protein
VSVEAVSVNPVDYKVRRGVDPAGEVKVLGYDAAGVVSAVGSEVSLFSVGDEVYYAGSIDRPGTNSDWHLVNENIVGRKPTTLSFAQAAAMPLTTITAWEALFDRLGLDDTSQGTILVVGAAGGVGSMLIQLARHLTKLTIIATASRPESRAWVSELGAHHVVDHRQGLIESVRGIAADGVDYLFSANSAGNIATFAEVLRPYGKIVAIDDPGQFDVGLLKRKSISWIWEFMFTAALFTPTDRAQHELLNEAARLVDEGVIRTALKVQLGPMNAETLRQAHAMVESGTMIGKVAITRE